MYSLRFDEKIYSMKAPSVTHVAEITVTVIQRSTHQVCAVCVLEQVIAECVWKVEITLAAYPTVLSPRLSQEIV